MTLGTLSARSLGMLGDCIDPTSGDSVVCPPGTVCDDQGNCIPVQPACEPLSNVGPLAPGQVYCETGTAARPATAPASTASRTNTNYILLGVGVLLLTMMAAKK